MRRLSITRYELPALVSPMAMAAEIGVDHGYFSYYLLKHYQLRKLWSVDNWSLRRQRQPDTRLDAESMLKLYGERSEIICGDSLSAAAKLEAEGLVGKLDFVYIDADHRYRAVVQDLEAWAKFVRPGGIFAGHDYLPANGCGVIQAVDEFAARTGWQLMVTAEHWASWAFVAQKG